MSAARDKIEGENLGILQTQALVVTCGPYEGRICENDDDDLLFEDNLTKSERAWFKKCGVKLSKISKVELDTDKDAKGVDVEIVTFGFYLECFDEVRIIPRNCLRPATTRDLVSRSSEISEAVFQDVMQIRDFYNREEIISLLKEQHYIVNELWRRERIVLSTNESKNVFLCHSSADKPFVRQIFSDLSQVGHRPWLDEYEIKVGDSIVEKINEAHGGAAFLVLCLSENSVKSLWVKKEWNAALARYISGVQIKILPILIEECKIPPILADIKYADFRESYNRGLEELLIALN